jgi:DNA polymerase II large subunit
MRLAATRRCEEYLLQMERELKNLYDLASKARSKGIDPSFEPETRVAKDLAEMVEGLVGPKKVAERIRELSVKMDPYEMAFVVSEDIIHAKFGHTDPEEAAEQAIKTALAIMTGGITAAPMQGIAHVSIKRNMDRGRYLALYFAGPIRSAGGTEQALILIIGDHIRRRLGLDRYKPTEDEVHRFIEEIRLYEREVGRFQYHISDYELENALRNLPVEVNGTETNPVEVSSFRNLPRIETNRVRGGALRVVNDGIVGRSQKVVKITEYVGIEGWEWLKQVRENNDENQVNVEYMYLEDVIAGRPIFSFPHRSGGFRLRYGRSRNTGLAALGVHPSTMTVLHNFLASGTQVRVDKPGKGGITLPVDTIEPPIVKLRDGSIIRVESPSEAKQLEGKIEKILFLGDLLVGFGEFLENNKPLEPSGYTEEWWLQDVWDVLNKNFNRSMEEAARSIAFPLNRLQDLLERPLEVKPTSREAIVLAEGLGVPLHPRFTYFWRNLDFEELSFLRGVLVKSERRVEGEALVELVFPSSSKVNKVLEKICVPMEIKGGRVILGQDALILASCLRIDESGLRLRRQNAIVETITALSGISVKEKALTFVGARMGRPEKAKARQMSPLVHVLFPMGLAGGSRRNLVQAAKKSIIQVEIARRKCSICGGITYRLTCPKCGGQTVGEKTCPRCKRVIEDEVCPSCRVPTVKYDRRPINIQEAYDNARKKLGINPELVKGVRGLMNKSRFPEAIEKGILRAKHGISIFKDGTVRFDATDAPLTHFKTEEIGVSLERLIQLGYLHDVKGMPIKYLDQTCELKIHDIIIPRSCAEYLLRTSQFIDDLLQKVYGLHPYYNVKRVEDLTGHLIMGLAPHTSAAVLGRILGFTEARVCYAHPLWHNVKRRDCDGDEDAVLLVLDVLLNFSKAYLPEQIGGMMDAPLLLISAINPSEVDEAHNVDLNSFYPRVFYEKTLKRVDPIQISEAMDLVAHRLGTPAQFEGYSFTHITYDINKGNLESSYVKLGAMKNKLRGQLLLAEKIQAVDAKEVARRVLSTHFMRDIAGNLKAFTNQRVRCKKCNAKFRRIPLSGKCSRCGGDLLLTVHQKGIEKYMDIAEQLVQNYELGNYYKQRLKLIKDEIQQLFSVEENGNKQVELGAFM